MTAPLVCRFPVTWTCPDGSADFGAIHLHYDPAYDPYAIGMSGADPHIRWGVLFARSLLAEGINHPTGPDGGDVQIHREAGTLKLALRDGDGWLVYGLSVRDVVAFLTDTQVAVPYDWEAVDVDAELALLLGRTP